MRTAVVVSLALTAAALGAARPASAEIQARIKVKAGDTLSTIARRHDCTVAALQRANDLPGTMILAGQELAVPVCRGKEAARPTRRVARIEIPLVAGQSVGRPWDGKLRRASQLPTGKGYLIRRPHRAYGAAHVVAHVRNAIARVRADHPRLHTLAIGDLSAKHGGSISEHRSHQSGRDLDLPGVVRQGHQRQPRSRRHLGPAGRVRADRRRSGRGPGHLRRLRGPGLAPRVGGGAGRRPRLPGAVVPVPGGQARRQGPGPARAQPRRSLPHPLQVPARRRRVRLTARPRPTTGAGAVTAPG